MKCTIPEISWHNRDPVLSLDVQPLKSGVPPYRLATGGTDSHVVIWYVNIDDNGLASVEVAADLQRHQKAVNTVRFSPSGQYLASGDDESVIIIWKPKTEHDISELSSNENETSKEQWVSMKFLRGHLEDVYDLSWSVDSSHLISGSIDNTAILWDIHKGRNIGILSGHGGFVQGVAWDPKNKYAATISSDRTCRIYNLSTKKLSSKIYKTTLPVPPTSEMDGKVVRLFHDDTLKSFFRRLSFSPDGQLLVAPSGIIEMQDADKHINATYIFTRYDFTRPVVYLPSPQEYTVAVRFCPLLFKLHEGDSLFALSYRMVFAVATKSNVILYDTQQPEPIALISNIHYTRLTDLSWSGNGRLLIASSSDGYCSIITFTENELGEEYEPSHVDTCDIGDVQNTVNKQPEKSNGRSSTGKEVQESSVIDLDDTSKQKCGKESDKTDKENSLKCHIPDRKVSSGDISVTQDLKSSMNSSELLKNDTDLEMDVDSEESISKCTLNKKNDISNAACEISNKKEDKTSSKPVNVGSFKKIESILLDLSPIDSSRKGNDTEMNKDNECKGGSAKGSTDEKDGEELMDIDVIESKTESCHVDKESNSEEKDNGSQTVSQSCNTSAKENIEESVLRETRVKEETPEKIAEGPSNAIPVKDHCKVSKEEAKNENEKSPSKISEAKDLCETTPSKSLTNGNATSVKETFINSSAETTAQTAAPRNVTPVANRTPRRVQLITLSSPKSKKKLL